MSADPACATQTQTAELLRSSVPSSSVPSFSVSASGVSASGVPSSAARSEVASSAETTAFTATTPIAIVANDFVSTGGMDAANVGLADYLARRGHPIHLVAHAVKPSLAAMPGVSVHKVGRPLNSNLLAAPLIDRAGRRIAAQIRSTGGRVIVNGGNCAFPDANWVHYVHAAFTPEVVGSLPMRIKNGIALRRFRADEKRALRPARIIIANSNRTRDDLIRLLALEPHRIHTVYYGIDADRFRPADAEERIAQRAKLGWSLDRPIVLFIGALFDRRKGFDTVFDAWTRLHAGGDWDVDLAVVGYGGELPAWQRRVAGVGLTDRIRFLGFRRDVPDLLRAADALVAPTRYEAYGLGVHEALCCGLPAIVSASAGVAEQYDASTQQWLIQNPDDAAEVAAALLNWRGDPTAARQRAILLSDRLRRHTWDKMAEQIEQLLAQNA